MYDRVSFGSGRELYSGVLDHTEVGMDAALKPQVTRFAGVIDQGEVRPGESTSRSTTFTARSRVVEWGPEDDDALDTPVTGCPGSLLRVSLIGTIDNARELTHRLTTRHHGLTADSGSEIIAHAYEEWGEACVEQLRGVFALVVWDERAGVLLLARDRLGTRPLYYCEVRRGFAFGSHLTALRQLVDVPCDIDPRAIDCYLALRAVPAPLSIFRSVRKLPAAHILKFEGGIATLKRYWSLDVEKKQRADEREASETLRCLLRDAVREISDQKSIGLMLSGGLDSAVILAHLSELWPGPIRSFSFAFTGGFNELSAARRTARFFRADSQELLVEPQISEVLPSVVRQYEEPHGNSSAINWYYYKNVIGALVSVVVCGEGADEVFGGRDRHLVAGLAERLYRCPGRRVMAALGAITASARIHEPVHMSLEGAALSPLDRCSYWMSTFSPVARAGLYSRDFAACVGADEVRKIISDMLPISAHPLDRALAVDLGLWVSEVLLATLNIDGITVRTPFLDHHVVELAASLPASWRVGWLTSKRFLRKAYAARLPAWLNDPWRRGGVKIPVGALLRGKLRPWIEDYVLSPTAMQRGYFEPSAVRRLAEEHIQGRADHGARLWTLLMLELWHRALLDR
jgi:asparagine synthase (glutamine-hydrolysing)